MSGQEGSVRARAEQVANGVREAAKHRRAPLLFAIGAERPKPQGAANAAEAFGLTNKEEKLAKWVGVLKRDAKELFGIPFLDALQNILSAKESRVMPEVLKGSAFFVEYEQEALRKLVRALTQAGIKFRKVTTVNLGSMTVFLDYGVSRSDSDIAPTEDFDGYFFCLWDGNLPRRGSFKPYGLVAAPRGKIETRKFFGIFKGLEDVEFGTESVYFGDGDLVEVGGLSDITLLVEDRRALKPVRAFARAWEAKSRQLKNSRDAKVTIIENFR